MKLIKTYEEFIFQSEIEKTPLLTDNPIDDSILSSSIDNGSYIDNSGVIHIKNWKVY